MESTKSSKRNLTKYIAVVAAMALVSGVLAFSASAHLGGSVRSPQTNGPDLVSANITNVDGQEVRYCFDEVVTDEGDPDDFFLQGWDEDDGTEGEDNGLASQSECVDVDFDAPTENEAHLEIVQYTIACVIEDSVLDRQSQDNPENCVTLQGSTAQGGLGRTAGPDLVSAQIESETSDTIICLRDKSPTIKRGRRRGRRR